MTSAWRTRLLILVLIGVLIEVSLVVQGMGPRLILVASAIVAGAAMIWFARDVGGAGEAVQWPATTAPVVIDTVDWRVRSLEMLLRGLRRNEASVARLRALLIDLVDDRLAIAHGIDRAADPDAAAAVLGPELARFVWSADPTFGLTKPGEVARMVELVEQL